MEFHETQIGKRFLDGTMPSIARHLEEVKFQMGISNIVSLIKNKDELNLSDTQVNELQAKLRPLVDKLLR